MVKKIYCYAKKCAALFLPAVLSWQCSLPFEYMQQSPPKLEPKTSVNKQLTSLPAPKEKVVATVYKFRDQSGQYKSTENGTSWSTAVTQGATSILIKALEESDWFIVIEREGLSNLLNERKIIRSSKANYEGRSERENQSLPPLLYAGIILEGGIISYDSNIRTGGVGLKYFGAGGSNQYREDRITIYLRAVATQNGRVLTTVYTSKTILSQMVDVGFYRYVNFKKLLEAEMGYSYNEPAEICVKEAIEKAVVSLVIEGMLHNLWAPADSSAMNSASINNYLKEKEASKGTDIYGRELTQEHSVGVGVNLGMLLYSGDYSGSELKSAFQVVISLPAAGNFDFTLGLGRGMISSKNYFSTTISSAELNMKYKFLPEYKLCPYVFCGGGISSIEVKNKFVRNSVNISKMIPQFISGFGFEYRTLEKIGLNFLIDYHYYFDDNLDGITSGNFKDYYWGARAGVFYYF